MAINFGTPGPPPRPVNFQRVMVFIDGTNLFYRVQAAKLRLKAKALEQICRHFTGGRQLVRVYLYTTKPKFEEAQKVHMPDFADGARLVFGDAVRLGDGNLREKGVDALLVADLVYHAAAKNYDYAVLISTDTDFAVGLRRVEDFGCRTAVVAVLTDLPARLKEATDQVFLADEQLLLSHGWAEQV